MQPQPAVDHRLPGIDARPVGAVVVRLEPPAGQQLGIGDQKVQLQTPLVRVLHPQNAVLIFIEAGHQNTLEAGHQFFPLAGRQICLRKRQYAGGVFLHVRRHINQLPDFFRLALQDGGAFTLPVFTQQIVHRPGATAATARMKFNDHRPFLSQERRAAAA
ncbi:hypothetical protein ACFV8Y_28705, partial [Bacillus cereus]|uniref:hypothetical protein n=7 Tax=Bacillati TaxID=1783272 RepID=UPI003661614B